jgi:hypothetical protein
MIFLKKIRAENKIEEENFHFEGDIKQSTYQSN